MQVSQYNKINILLKLICRKPTKLHLSKIFATIESYKQTQLNKSETPCIMNGQTEVRCSGTS